MKINKTAVDFIVIACCTYKRPKQLERLIISLTEMYPPPDITIKILIIDNDKNKSAEVVFEKFKNKADIHYIVEENKGLSNVRNRALRTAIELNASHIAFIDDDEIADKNWLINHINFYNKFEDIYISSGLVNFKFENKHPNYIVNNNIFKSYNNKNLGKIKKTCGCGNVFMPLNIVKENNIYFSEEFNLSGGEDTDFFNHFSCNNYNIGWNYNAITYEIVDNSRTNVKWILKRAYNNGRITGYTKINNKKTFIEKKLYIINELFKLVLNSILAPCSILFGMTVFVNKLIDVSGNIGKISGASQYKLSNFYGENND